MGRLYHHFDFDHLAEEAAVKRRFFTDKSTQTIDWSEVEKENRELRTKLHELKQQEFVLAKERGMVDRRVAAAEAGKTNLKSMLSKSKVELSSMKKKYSDLTKEIENLKVEKQEIVDAMDRKARDNARS